MVRFLEDHNYYMEQCTIGTMRESIFAVGQELVSRDQIDHLDDVFHFSIEGRDRSSASLRSCRRRRHPE